MKNKLIVVLSVLMAGLSACKQQEKEKPKYSASFEIVVPVYQTPEAFCPASLRLGADREIMERLENELTGDNGSGVKYIHCHACNMGVYRLGEDGISSCSYCGVKQDK